MKLLKLLIFFLLLLEFFPLIACDDQKNIAYPSPANDIDEEIDFLLKIAEHNLFKGDFSYALEKIERAHILLPLTNDCENYRELRILFTKAIAATCIEGPTENSLNHFVNFETLLDTKMCSHSSKKKESVVKKSWSLFGSEKMSPIECIEKVDKTMSYALSAARKLPINIGSLTAIESSIYLMGKKSKECCTENGFWQACIQPLVDAMKNMTIFRIP